MNDGTEEQSSEVPEESAAEEAPQYREVVA